MQISTRLARTLVTLRRYYNAPLINMILQRAEQIAAERGGRQITREDWEAACDAMNAEQPGTAPEHETERKPETKMEQNPETGTDLPWPEWTKVSRSCELQLHTLCRGTTLHFTPCACLCHTKTQAAEPPTCERCGGLLDALELAGTGAGRTCNDCLRARARTKEATR